MNNPKLCAVLILLGTVTCRAALATPTITLDQHTTSLPASARGLYQVGELVQFDLTASNRGSDATGVVVRYDWPDGLRFVDATSADGAAMLFNAAGDQLSWHIGDLAGSADGDAATLSVTALVDAGSEGKVLGGRLSIAAMDQPAHVPTAVAEFVRVQSISTVDLQIASVNNYSQQGGTFNVTYDVTVTNNGPDVATGVFLQVTIDPVTFDAIEDGGFSAPAGVVCDEDALSCFIGDIDPGMSVDIRITAVVLLDAAPINIGAQLDALSNDTDTDLGNNGTFAVVSLPEVGGGDDGGGGAADLWLLMIFGLVVLALHRGDPAEGAASAAPQARDLR